jgi:hypothetical protein
MAQGMGETQMHMEAGTLNFDTMKVGLEMTSVSFVSPAIQYDISNAIQCRPIDQIIEWSSLDIHEG